MAKVRLAEKPKAEKSKNGGDALPRAAREVGVVEVDMAALGIDVPAADTFAPIARDEIERRAYARFLQRGCQHGDDWADWFQAEAEVQAERGQAEGRVSR